MPRKPQCMIDGCTRHTFALEPVCLPHFRALNITLGADPEPDPVRPVAPLGEAGSAAPEPSPAPVQAEPRRPTRTASKAAWVDWAIHRHGVSRQTAESANKAQLIELCREDDVPVGES